MLVILNYISLLFAVFLLIGACNKPEQKQINRCADPEKVQVEEKTYRRQTLGLYELNMKKKIDEILRVAGNSIVDRYQKKSVLVREGADTAIREEKFWISDRGIVIEGNTLLKLQFLINGSGVIIDTKVLCSNGTEEINKIITNAFKGINFGEPPASASNKLNSFEIVVPSEYLPRR
ncbi:hypothetical protein [Leptospira sarikeiensis]|uniref:Uncharacterized protein n=1 Tax=Leptospira sarikeiensis TaxID=2484943 RepID=A0A4R9K781_9LEPT|nr:hypothetical protein [Leptospira sarikeiensis]TGL61154.1 hypothetical protein EHQ64_11070 [Leptospira sarikeiensis]